MSKELYFAIHEELAGQYLEDNFCDQKQAYEATADQAFEVMRDRLADQADDLRQRRKEGLA